MSDYLKRYEVTIKTKSPIYIGSGNTIKKKEYYFDAPNKKVYIFDMRKMFNGLLAKGLEKKYEYYMFNSKAPKDLNMFFRDNNITKKDFIKWIDYTIDVNDTEFQKKDINTFYKESGNRVSIPGSSIKGAIRTALLADELRNNRDKYINYAESIYRDSGDYRNQKSIMRESENLEKKILRTLERNKDGINNAVNDVMSGVRISDSEIIPKDRLTLCQKIDFSVDKDENKLPIYYECIKPETTIKTTIVIDKSIQDDVDIERIERAISNFSWYLYQDFGYFFYSDEYRENELFIGGSTGFVSKTIIYTLMEEENARKTTQNILKNAFRKHKHDKDIQNFGISPRMQKKTIYKGSLYEMGLVSIDFKEIK